MTDIIIKKQQRTTWFLGGLKLWTMIFLKNIYLKER